jgi:hypothetical protein
VTDFVRAWAVAGNVGDVVQFDLGHAITWKGPGVTGALLLSELWT